MVEKIKFKDWRKVDLRVGEIIKAEKHPNADKLYILTVDVGEERKIVTGLKDYYELEGLKGKKIVVFCNLEEKEFRGVKSEGMLLAAVKNNKVVLLKPEKEIDNGAKVE